MIVEQMAIDLGLPTAFVESLARSASHEYKTYTIPKRTGGHREIHHPSMRLKALQRWLLVNVIESLPVHAAARAYRKSQSIFDNANLHASSRYLLRMDLVNFFPSITQVDLAKYIAERPNLFSAWAPSDIDVFCRIVCRNAVLTIGAPTSPALSNAICCELDTHLQGLCERHGVIYTRYADDLFFSSMRPNVLRQLETEVGAVVSGLRLPAHLRINVLKTRHSSKRRARRVTGIVLGSDGRPHVGREIKRKIRALIFRLDSLDEETRSSLAGLIAYTTGFEKGFMNNLIAKYGLSTVRAAAALPGRKP